MATSFPVTLRCYNKSNKYTNDTTKDKVQSELIKFILVVLKNRMRDPSAAVARQNEAQLRHNLQSHNFPLFHERAVPIHHQSMTIALSADMPAEFRLTNLVRFTGRADDRGCKGIPAFLRERY